MGWAHKRHAGFRSVGLDGGREASKGATGVCGGSSKSPEFEAHEGEGRQVRIQDKDLQNGPAGGAQWLSINL